MTPTALRPLAALLCLLFSAGTAQAIDVYVNTVKVTGALQNVNFDNVKVAFDAKGNVLIDAPGYAIEASDGAAKPPAAPVAAPPMAPAVAGTAPQLGAGAVGRPVKRYWLIVNTPKIGQYKVNIKANGKPVAEVPGTQAQFVTEVTSKLAIGNNSATVTFLPMPTAPAGVTGEAVNVMIGEGQQGADGTLTINRVLGTAKMDAGIKSAVASPLSFEVR